MGRHTHTHHKENTRNMSRQILAGLAGVSFNRATNLESGEHKQGTLEVFFKVNYCV